MEHRTHYWSHVITLLIALSVMLVSLSFSQKKSINKLPVVSEALNSWQQTNGPEGTHIYCITYDETRSTLYMSCGMGFYARKNFEWYKIGTTKCRSMSINSNGEILLGVYKIGNMRLYTPPVSGTPDQGTIQQLGTKSFSDVYASLYTSNGDKYAGDYEGLWKFDGTDWVKQIGSSGTPPTYVKSIFTAVMVHTMTEGCSVMEWSMTPKKIFIFKV